MEKSQTLFSSSPVDGKIVIYTDGGARGNPGPAACGFTINGRPYGAYLGTTTNNVAEYQGVIQALKKVTAMIGKDKIKNTELEVRMDSELLVKQFNNEYKIKEEHLQPLYVQVHNLVLDFKKVIFIHVRREQNKEADAMVNKYLDVNQ